MWGVTLVDVIVDGCYEQGERAGGWQRVQSQRDSVILSQGFFCMYVAEVSTTEDIAILKCEEGASWTCARLTLQARISSCYTFNTLIFSYGIQKNEKDITLVLASSMARRLTFGRKASAIIFAAQMKKCKLHSWAP
jgi:hypothetical protein